MDFTLSTTYYIQSISFQVTEYVHFQSTDNQSARLPGVHSHIQVTGFFCDKSKTETMLSCSLVQLHKEKT